MNDPAVFENPCAVCNARVATRLCDYVVGYDDSAIFLRDYKSFVEANSGCRHETCDVPMCETCAKRIGRETDFCPHHHKIYEQARRLPDRLKKAKMRNKVRTML